MARAERDLSRVTRTTPLLLIDAAALAFPDGTMLASTLRREAARRKLTVWKVAGKLRTSLEEIDRMLDRCRVPADPLASGSDPQGMDEPQSGSSSTEDDRTAQVAAQMRVERLKQRFGPTSAPSTSPPRRVVGVPPRRP